MSRVWTVRCKGCDNPISYSDAALRAAIDRGHSPPERCAECRANHRRATSRLGAAYLDLEPGRPVPPGGLKAGRLGKIQRPARPRTDSDLDTEPIGDDEFGIKDEHIVELLNALRTHQVAIVQAGTGSGKSTFLPWRLLMPPAPFERDHLTRHGQIVVTQPRIDASTEIPEFVASRLHGSFAGPGLDIGYRNSKALNKTDAANKLVYLTDGTLVNMIRKGDLHAVSAVVIDEAHERSLNIDLILALLRRELHSLPHLRLLIVSATLESHTFTEFFEPDFPVASLRMPSKTIHPVYERWRTEPIPKPQWPRKMPGAVADTAIEVLRWMFLDERPRDIPDDVPTYQGDILCFLPGKRPIAEAIEEITTGIEDDPELSRHSTEIEILPLHSELPNKQRRRAIDASTRPRGVSTRIIVSTDLAETSLTIDRIRHVIDSGLRNLKSWDPVTGAERLRPMPHSKSGLLQRRGRAGRKAPGIWHCQFTREQFDELDFATPPDIARSPLTAVVLNAAAAGVSDPESLRWLAPGPTELELQRARADLCAIGAITASGDPTSLGRELNNARAEFSDSALLVNADKAGCAVEAATVLAAKSRELGDRHVLSWNTSWPAAAKVHVDAVHSALLGGAADDLEVICRVVSFWEDQPPDERPAWAARYYIDHNVVKSLVKERTQMLVGLQSRTRTATIRPIDLGLLPRLRAVIAWNAPNDIYLTERDRDHTVHLRPFAAPRSDPAIIDNKAKTIQLSVDPKSRARRLNGEHVAVLARTCVDRWTSPLKEPIEIQQGTLCAVVDPSALQPTGTLIGALAGIPVGERPCPPQHIPGDRFVALISDGQVTLGEKIDPLPDPTVPIDVDGTDDDDDSDPPVVVVDGAEADELPVDESDVDDIAAADIGEHSRTSGPELPAAELDQAHHTTTGITTVAVVGQRAQTLVVTPDDAVAEFAEFMQAHPVGSNFDVVVDEVRSFTRDTRPLLITHDRQTHQRVLVDGGHLGTGLRYSQTRRLHKGAILRLAVEGYDVARLTPYFGQTGVTIAALWALRGQEHKRVVSAVVVDVAEGYTWFEILTERDGSRTPPLVCRVESARLPVLAQGLDVGQRVRAQASWGRRPAAVQVDITDIAFGSARLPDGPWEIRGAKLVLTDTPVQRDWERIVDYVAGLPDQVAAARLRARLAAAIMRTMRPRISVIDREAIEEMRARGVTSARIVSVDDNEVRFELPTGHRPAIRTDQLSWDDTVPAFSVGAHTDVFVTEANPDSGSVVIALRNPAGDPFLSVQVGDVVDGRVARVQPDYAIVEVRPGSISAIVHISEISWTRVQSAEDHLPVGTEVRAAVTNINRDDRRLSLSIKATQPHPVDVLRDSVGVGGRVEGIVTRIKDKSVNVDIDGGALGIIYISELDWTLVGHPSDVVSRGQRIPAEITGFKEDQNLVLLSLKRTEPHPYELLRQRGQVGDLVQARVTKVDGAFVNVIVDGGVHGSIHISELDWARVEDAAEVLRENQTVAFMILEFRDDRRRVKLSLKRTRPNPKDAFLETARQGQVVEGTVTAVMNYGAFIDLGYGVKGLVHISAIAPYRIGNVADELYVGQPVRAVILGIDERNRISLSIKDCP